MVIDTATELLTNDDLKIGETESVWQSEFDESNMTFLISGDPLWVSPSKMKKMSHVEVYNEFAAEIVLPAEKRYYAGLERQLQHYMDTDDLPHMIETIRRMVNTDHYNLDLEIEQATNRKESKNGTRTIQRTEKKNQGNLRTYASQHKVKRVPYLKNQIIKFIKTRRYRLDVRTPDGGLRIDCNYTEPGMRVKELEPNGHYRIAIAGEVFYVWKCRVDDYGWFIERIQLCIVTLNFAAIVRSLYSGWKDG